MPRNTFNGFSLWIDGIGYQGQVKEIELPELNSEVVEHKSPSGLGTQEFDRNLEAMEATITMIDYYPELQALSADHSTPRRFQVRGNVSTQTATGKTDQSLVISLRGRFKGRSTGAFNSEDPVESEYMVAVDAYAETYDGVELINISCDPPRRVINGTDLEAQRRANLGGV